MTLSITGQWDAPSITEQAAELGWRYNPLESRNEHGEWSHAGSVVGDALSGMKWSDAPGSDYEAPPADRLSGKAKASDNPFIKKYGLSADHIVASYDAASPDERAQGARWYSDAHDVAQAIGKGDAAKGAAMLSAFSPQTDWATDVMNAASTLATGKVPDHGVGITGSVRSKAQAILAAKNDQQIDDLFPAVGSAKTRNFYQLIRNGGDTPDDADGKVVIDRHALSVAAGRRLTQSETTAPTYDDIKAQHPDWSREQMQAYRATFPDDPTGSAYTYQHIADMYRQAAKTISDRDHVQMSPHQLQAMTWLHQLHSNDTDDSHLMELAADAVRHGGKMSSVAGAATAKGRASAMSKRWATWGAYAQAHQIPIHSGTTALTGGSITAQYDMALSAEVRQRMHDEAHATASATAKRDYLRDRRGRFASDNGTPALTEAFSGLSSRIGQLRADKSIPYDLRDRLRTAQTQLHQGNTASAANTLMDVMNDKRVSGHSDDLRSILHDTWAQASAKNAADADAARGIMDAGAVALPGMFGDDEHLDWDGKAPDLIPDDAPRNTRNGRLLAYIDWDGHVTMRQGIADGLAADAASAGPVMTPENYTVPLHEMIHAVIPAGQRRETNGDEQAYMDPAKADIEEGFTELGTIQHAGDWFRAVGIADRETPYATPSDDAAWDTARDDLNSAAAAARDSLMAVSPRVSGRADTLDASLDAASALSASGDDSKFPALITGLRGLGLAAAADQVQGKLDALRAATGGHQTMAEHADQVNTPARIRAGNAWGHYPKQTAQAFDWTSMIAQMRTGKPEGDPETQTTIRQIADEVNAVGTASKLRVMAEHVAGDMGTPEILPSVEDSLAGEWNQGLAASQVYQHARNAAVQRLAALQAERQAV